MSAIDEWYLKNLVCPIDSTALSFVDGHLVSANGRRYPVVDGIPVLLVRGEKQTIGVAQDSIDRAEGGFELTDLRAPELYAETLGISRDEKEQLLDLYMNARTHIDPVAMMMIGATCGHAYKDLVGRLQQYPIPSISLSPRKPGDLLLDVGCNWGRWSISAAKKGFSVVGVDPSLGAIMAARRIAKEFHFDTKVLVADARCLPFPANAFDHVYSYSVLQHFSKPDARRAIYEMNRILRPGGVAKVQMANKWGLRSLQHQAVRKGREPENFEVRYWTLAELSALFSKTIGPTAVSADCYFGLGLQWSDYRYLNYRHKAVLVLSEGLRRLSNVISPMRHFADSLFCTSTKSLTKSLEDANVRS